MVTAKDINFLQNEQQDLFADVAFMQQNKNPDRSEEETAVNSSMENSEME